MTGFTDELLAICRTFGFFEREAVCCGTVSVPQCVALQELLGGPRDVSDLATRLGVTNSAATRLVDGLERRGFVERQRGSDDRRRVEVDLTEAGRLEAGRLRRATETAVSAVLERVPADKRRQVVESVALVRRAVEAARDELTACCGPPAGGVAKPGGC